MQLNGALHGDVARDGWSRREPQLERLIDLPLLDVVIVDLETGAIHSVGAQVASDVNPPSWTPDGALLIDRYLPGD